MIKNVNIILSTLPYIALICSIVALQFITGCGDGTSLAELCEKNSEICEEFGKDSWCKRQQIDVALARIKVKENKLDVDKFELIVAYENYIRCMDLASQIQHIKLKEKTTLRKNNLMKAKANLAELSADNKSSSHPHLLYYYWSREGNKVSLDRFLAMEGTNSLESSIAQYHLATYYIKKDTNKTLGYLFHALELHQPGTQVLPEILQSLATIFTKRQQYKQGYIWLKTYQLTLSKPDDTIEISLKNYRDTYQLEDGFLDKVANKTLDKIKSGNFVSPKF